MGEYKIKYSLIQIINTFAIDSKGDSGSIHRTQGGGRGWGKGALRLTDFFGGQEFNDVYMMNFTSETPKWLKTESWLNRYVIKSWRSRIDNRGAKMICKSRV
jgi:hypothetical protein